MTATHDDALLRRVEQFLFDQSDMLDSRRWQDWINLFTKDGVYWMPAIRHMKVAMGCHQSFMKIST